MNRCKVETKTELYTNCILIVKYIQIVKKIIARNTMYSGLLKDTEINDTV